MSTSSSSTSQRPVLLRWARMLVGALLLVSVVLCCAVMSSARQMQTEPVSASHSHAATDLHAAGTGHGVADARAATFVPDTAVTSLDQAPASSPVDALLRGVEGAVAMFMMLIAAVTIAGPAAVARWFRRLLAAATAVVRAIPRCSWPPVPPTPASLSVFRI